jgi:hypothetical protein
VLGAAEYDENGAVAGSAGADGVAGGALDGCIPLGGVGVPPGGVWSAAGLPVPVAPAP